MVYQLDREDGVDEFFVVGRGMKLHGRKLVEIFVSDGDLVCIRLISTSQ